ncbi:OLC1v1011314C1 [Oldenlandia corymbosa var. corymbosa]|uniref:OLC1v1011314C1 n=1 Tax=Oldenlandia corymbosa var. corymbosa TaxID=529605 RepID=A0AAV1DWT8_OLDCO|nr:OLC1v1011314C1 [Oldenlandia corymbosa var. corymbosa]
MASRGRGRPRKGDNWSSIHCNPIPPSRTNQPSPGSARNPEPRRSQPIPWANQNKIKSFLECEAISKKGEVLVQLWNPVKDSCRKTRITLSAPNQSIGFGRITRDNDGLFRFRSYCLDDFTVVEDDGNPVSPFGRVWKQKFPEYCPNIECYSTQEFPPREFSIACGIKQYWALPLYEVYDVLDKVRKKHQLPLIQVWVPRMYNGHEGVVKGDTNPSSSSNAESWMITELFPHLTSIDCNMRFASEVYQMASKTTCLVKAGKGLVGKAYSLKRTCFLTDTSRFSINIYPLEIDNCGDHHQEDDDCQKEKKLEWVQQLHPIDLDNLENAENWMSFSFAALLLLNLPLCENIATCLPPDWDQELKPLSLQPPISRVDVTNSEGSSNNAQDEDNKSAASNIKINLNDNNSGLAECPDRAKNLDNLSADSNIRITLKEKNFGVSDCPNAQQDKKNKSICDELWGPLVKKNNVDHIRSTPKIPSSSVQLDGVEEVLKQFEIRSCSSDKVSDQAKDISIAPPKNGGIDGSNDLGREELRRELGKRFKSKGGES